MACDSSNFMTNELKHVVNDKPESSVEQPQFFYNKNVDVKQKRIDCENNKNFEAKTSTLETKQ